MNNVRQCRRCRKLFNYVASPYCPRCIDEIDREYRVVRDYIYENPHAGIKEIADATEVNDRTILQLLREGRLELDSSVGGLSCERCGTSINTGRYCDSCQAQLSSELRQAQKSIAGGAITGVKAGNQADKHFGNKKSVEKREFNEGMHSRN
jgi:flagellar operon protein (TIGR03826 family)